MDITIAQEDYAKSKMESRKNLTGMTMAAVLLAKFVGLQKLYGGAKEKHTRNGGLPHSSWVELWITSNPCNRV